MVYVLKVKLVVLDLDGTLWDHMDASSLLEPLETIDHNTVVDSKGEVLRLYPDARWFLEKLWELGLPVAIASWNHPDITVKILELLGVKKYFSYLGIEPHPHKYKVLLKIMDWYKHKYGYIHPGEILYVDDRRIHLEEIHERIGQVMFIQMWKYLPGFRELYEYILAML